MNFRDIQRQVFWNMGRPDETALQDHERQQVKDAINFSFDNIIADVQPYLWHHLRISTIAVVSGTAEYTLNDRCLQPLSFWTQDDKARQIPFVDPGMVDADGTKNTNATSSWPEQFSWYPPTTEAGSSGTGDTLAVTSGGTAVTKAAGTAFASTDVGKVIRLDGEAEFVIKAVAGDNALTLASAYVGRLSGVDTTNTPGSLTDAEWQISPPGRYRVQLNPAVTESETVYYRYVQKHSRLVSDTDVPDLPERYHTLLVYGALLHDTLMRERNEQHQSYYRRYAHYLEQLISENTDSVGANYVQSYASGQNYRRGENWYPRGTDLGRRR